MSDSRFILGTLGLAAMAAALAWGAARLQRRLAPSLTGPTAVLAQVIFVIAGFVVVGEGLGTVGLFKFALVVAVGVALGLGVGWRAGPGPAVTAAADAPPTPRIALAIAGLSVFVVAVDYVARSVTVLRFGIQTSDSLSYHLPFAAGSRPAAG